MSLCDSHVLLLIRSVAFPEAAVQPVAIGATRQLSKPPPEEYVREFCSNKQSCCRLNPLSHAHQMLTKDKFF